MHDAPVMLPGFVTAIAVHRGNATDFLSRTEMEAMGGADAVHRRARENARQLPEPRIGSQTAKPWDPTTGMFAYNTETAVAPEAVTSGWPASMRRAPGSTVRALLAGSAHV